MAYAVIGHDETPEQLSVRLGRPVCMLMRANRLYSTSWLLPGRQIVVPDADFCRHDVGACPVAMLQLPAERFEERCEADDLHLPPRLRRWSDTHGCGILPEWRAAQDVRTLRPGESMRQFASRVGGSEDEIRRINRYYGKAVPGVQLLIPGEQRGE